MKTSLLLNAAIAGLMASTPALAADAAPPAAAAKGHCMGANACKGKSACATATNGCAGQNACKGKGFTENTKIECEKAMKKNKKIKFEG